MRGMRREGTTLRFPGYHQAGHQRRTIADTILTIVKEIGNTTFRL